jgi:hypothetical protein
MTVLELRPTAQGRRSVRLSQAQDVTVILGMQGKKLVLRRKAQGEQPLLLLTSIGVGERDQIEQTRVVIKGC